MGKNKDLKQVIDDAGAGIQNAGKAIVDKVTDTQRQQAEKIEKRRDALYSDNAHIGKEQLALLRKPIPDASPYLVYRLLEEGFLKGISTEKDEELQVRLKQDYILTTIELYGGTKVPVESRRDCMALIEAHFRNYKWKKNTEKTIEVALTLADLALSLIPGLKDAKFFKNAKFLKKLNVQKVVAYINRALVLLRLARDKFDSSSPDVQAAKKTIEQVQSKLGPVPSAWIVGETNV
jgi:hypothetical protein